PARVLSDVTQTYLMLRTGTPACGTGSTPIGPPSVGGATPGTAYGTAGDGMVPFCPGIGSSPPGAAPGIIIPGPTIVAPGGSGPQSEHDADPRLTSWHGGSHRSRWPNHDR